MTRFMTKVQVQYLEQFRCSRGRLVLFITICLLVICLAYRSRFSSRSWRKVAPCKEMPANTPREREYERIFAVILASVWAVLLRPTGRLRLERTLERPNRHGRLDGRQ
jgi:hypothetical protein